MAEANRTAYLDAQHRITIKEQPLPRPGPGEALARVKANGIRGSDIPFYPDSLGRPDGSAQRSPCRPELRAQGEDASGPWDGPTLRVQRDVDRDESSSAGLYGVQAALQRVGGDQVSSSADSPCREEGVSDLGWISGGTSTSPSENTGTSVLRLALSAGKPCVVSSAILRVVSSA